MPSACSMLAGARLTPSIFVVVFNYDGGAAMMMFNNNRSAMMLNYDAAMVVVAIVMPLRRCGNADTAVAYRTADTTGKCR